MRARSVFFSAQGACVGEIEVGRARARRPDRAGGFVQLLGVHRRLRSARWRRSVSAMQRFVVLAEPAAASALWPSKFLLIIDSERCARLPKLLARSALLRLTNLSRATVAVLAERDFAQEVEAHRVDAELLDQRERIDDVAERLRHLLAFDGQEAVREDALLHGDAGAHQEGRPVDRVEADDVLADDVQVGRPELLELLALRRPGSRRR